MTAHKRFLRCPTLLIVLSGATMLPLFAASTKAAMTIGTSVHALTLGLAITSLLVAPLSARELLPARRMLAAALAAAGAGMLAFVLYSSNGVVPVRSLANPISLAWVPLAVLGFWRIPRGRSSKTTSVRLFADAALSTSALLFVTWLVVLEPVMQDGGSTLALLVQAASPLSDVFVAALILALLPLARQELRGFFDLVMMGFFLNAIGDMGSTLHVVQHGGSAFGWPDIPLQVGLTLFVFAPWQRGGRRSSSRWRALVDANIAQAGVIVAVGAAIWAVSNGHDLDLAEVALVIPMLAALIFRQLLHSSELLTLAEEHRVAAEQDPLTALASRHAFLKALSHEMARPEQSCIGVLLVDLDGFREVNDNFGSGVGDAVLREVGTAVRQACTPHLVARMGSDEFAVLVVSAHPAMDTAAFGQLLAGSRALQLPESNLDIGLSAGWALDVDGDAPKDVLARAELALQAAKGGPVQAVAYSVELTARSQRRHLLIAGLAQAAERGELSLAYQPVRGLVDGRIAAVEALIRWQHPQLGNVPPCEFIPLAEDSGQILEIGTWVLRQAIAQLGRWDATGHMLPHLFVNFSAEQLTQDLPQLVLDLLVTHGVSPHRLVLEVTESQLPDLAANASLAQLRSAGVQVALDDFGSGYSSLAQLVRLPVDILKLDRDLIINLAQDGGEAVLRAAVALAHELGLWTVTEGIETGSQLDAVRRAGADMGQGYLFSRPVTADAIQHLLSSEDTIPRPRRALLPAVRQ